MLWKYIEDSFVTIFSMGYGGSVQRPPHGLWVGKIAHGQKGVKLRGKLIIA